MERGTSNFLICSQLSHNSEVLVSFFLSKHSTLSSYSAGRQTVERLKSFIESKKLEKFLQDLQPDLGSSRVEEHVIRNAAKENQKGVKRGSEAEKMRNLKTRILEEKQTLFFVVHDEAHCAPLKNKHLDRLINDKGLRFASNLILLQVSATPYCLVTKNTRIQHRNHLDMYRYAALTHSPVNLFFN